MIRSRIVRVPDRGARLRGAAIGGLALAVGFVPIVATAQTLDIRPLVEGPERPTSLVSAFDGSGRMFIATKPGRIAIWDGDEVLETPFLDIADRINSGGVERGMHGLAFHPDYGTNGFFYVTYTNLESDTHVSRFQVSSDEPNLADRDSEEVLLFIDQPNQYHNVSQLQFGPDGYLYIGAGDGGFAGDPGNRAQNLGELLGKILRIDVDGGFPYVVPQDNPFVGVPGARPEIWAYGVRNPWRFSFDRLNGDMYMGDVGQSTWEEVNFQPGDSPGGENYGWRRMEGRHCFDPEENCNDGTLTLPIVEYRHDFFGGGCSVTGGYVYRGDRFPNLEGVYLFADWCSGEITGVRKNSQGFSSAVLYDSALSPTTFGENEEGEMFLADDLGGVIYEIVDPTPFCDVDLAAASYGAGDEVVVSSLRLVNLGQPDLTARVRIAVVAPSGRPTVVQDIGDDGSLVLARGVESDVAPVSLFTVEASTPRGDYEVACRIEMPDGGVVDEHRTSFTIE